VPSVAVSPIKQLSGVASSETAAVVNVDGDSAGVLKNSTPFLFLYLMKVLGVGDPAVPLARVSSSYAAAESDGGGGVNDLGGL